MAHDLRSAWDRERTEILTQHAAAYAEVALANIDREFPHHESHLQADPAPIGRPRDNHPAFYGSFDWHSCVEMHWVLVRLLRLVPGALPQARVRAALNEHLAAEPLAAEAAFFAARGPGPAPYAWGWLLTLAHEATLWPDPDAARWGENLEPLADLCRRRFRDWLPRATYPVRHGMHVNSAFGLSLALDDGSARDRPLRDAMTGSARRWFGGDRGFVAEGEPSGIDFLSPTLTEAELMASVLGDEFPAWLDAFLPRLAEREPRTLFTPATVSDASDGLIAHLHGLNLSRAWCFTRLAAALDASDRRTPALVDAARIHAAAALDHVAGDDYMVEHWLAVYTVLLLTA